MAHTVIEFRYSNKVASFTIYVHLETKKIDNILQ